MRQLGLILLILAGVAIAAPAQSCPPGRTALVLSGGGAKGLAHIGVLRVMDSLRIRPDLIVGTSMGAIVGALYASGYSGTEIDSIARTLHLDEVFRSYEPLAPLAFGPAQPLVVWEAGEGGIQLQPSSGRESQINSLLNASMLQGNLLARGHFDSLPIPYSAVATNLAGRQLVVLTSGDLAQAVRASMSIPLVFQPEEIDGHVLVDGGLVDNIPVNVARDQGATRLIVSDVSDHASDTVRVGSQVAMAERLMDLLLQQTDDSLGPRDVYIRPEVEGFGTLDFASGVATEIVQLGYEAARQALQGPHCLPSGDRPEVKMPTLLIDEVSIIGGRPANQRFVLRELSLVPGDTLNPVPTRRGLLSLARSQNHREVWLRPQGPPDSLRLSLSLRPAPQLIAGLGLAYDNDLGGEAWIGVSYRNLIPRVEADAVLLVGNFLQAFALGFQSAAVGLNPVTPVLRGIVDHEDVRVFDSQGDELPSISIGQVDGFAGVQSIFGRGWLAAAGLVGLAWHEAGVGDLSTLGGRVRILKGQTLSSPDYLMDIGVYGVYQRIELRGFPDFRVGRAHVIPGFIYGWGDDLPPQDQFPLGGFDGFPGLSIGELRGDREAYLGLTLTHPIIGPVSIRGEGATGLTAYGGPAIPDAKWLVGGRIGLGADTPIGPVRVEYGVSTGGRDAFLVRLGRWF